VNNPPYLGLQWTPGITDKEAARRLIIFLEDKRLLYQDPDREDPELSVLSAIKIREDITAHLPTLRSKSRVSAPARLIRDAAREFCSNVDAYFAAGGNLSIGLPVALMEDGKILEVYDNSSVPDFYEALARLRNQAGTQIG
jgi:hypothetical protein